MAKNPNIYEGDTRRIVEISISVVIPDGLTGDDENNYIDSIFEKLKTAGSFTYSLHNATKTKMAFVKDMIVRGWEYVNSVRD